MAIKCKRIHKQLLLLIGIFIVLNCMLNVIPQYQILQKNKILFDVPHLDSTLFNNHSTTIVTRKREPVQIWKLHPSDDRILAQVKFRPNVDFTSLPPKRILLAQGLSGWGVQNGNKAFVEHQCPVQNCHLLEHPPSSEIIDARIFKEIELNENMYREALSVVPRHPDQAWIMFGLESPEASPMYANLNDVINWTATYRYDSTIVTPYDKFKAYDNFTNISDYKPNKNFAASKTKMAAIFMSNCYASNNRLDIVKELQQFISVDFYGACGTLTCERGNEKTCFQKLKDEYKFYLSFENANCRDYITDKLFLNALRNDVVPVVMGAHPDDYSRMAPPGSYIHVEDFRSVQELANYLKFLNQNDDEYIKYFRWKQTGSFIDTKFWCRICSLLWDHEKPRMSVPYLNKWWRGKGVCIGRGRWDKEMENIDSLKSDLLFNTGIEYVNK
ncbi:glycoprotein 3-alpha-L-fucosyltransferase A-like [Dreissena polymorpha]|uniref:Fucosyltransferase n=1 Tax=Dreissena polymorpha TaxID=45954 RepID=A0A9D4FUZ1_DREPO|nr:glycoprotein 3-alpha-L-fucosyltransferase A-like [Dreissena polymorpha]KAH3804089.1 hypothetical protein DPMN_132370 [Dreissena polymorpha]